MFLESLKHADQPWVVFVFGAWNFIKNGLSLLWLRQWTHKKWFQETNETPATISHLEKIPKGAYIWYNLPFSDLIAVEIEVLTASRVRSWPSRKLPRLWSFLPRPTMTTRSAWPSCLFRNRTWPALSFGPELKNMLKISKYLSMHSPTSSGLV